jgi:tetratricopeptide (TPR) repeat protein
MLARVLLGVVCAVGCKGKAEDAAAPVPAGSGSAIATPAAGSGSGSGSGSADAAVVPEDPKLRAAYRAGMRTGRKATDAKRWAEAIAGFDEALAAKPNDPRALGERGFAKLLEGKDLAAASRDLDLAAGGTKDPKLLSTIAFNRGLIEEKRGNSANAIAWFVLANTLRPTAAAAKKIAGNTCPVRVAKELTLDYKPIDGGDVVAIVNAMPAETETKVKTPEEAWERITEARTAPAFPAIVTASDGAERVTYVVWKYGTQHHALPIGVHQSGGRCPGGGSYEIVAKEGTRIHVRGAELYEGGYTYMCEGKDDELVECTDAAGEVSAGTACLGGSGTLNDIVLDLATGKVLLALTQPEDKPATIALDPGGVKLSGRGCDRVQPL